MSRVIHSTFAGFCTGWIGLISMPIIIAEGYSSAISTHQIPLPHPTSRILGLAFSVAGGRGAKCNEPPFTCVRIQCCSLSRWISGSSLGM